MDATSSASVTASTSKGPPEFPQEKVLEIDAVKAHSKRIDLRFKETIAEELIAATERGEVRPVERFSRLATEAHARGAVVYMTANWDRSLEEIFTPEARKYVFHLHGDVSNPSLLFLPTETTEERYRTVEERNLAAERNSNLIPYVERAKTLHLYGLSLDPSDAELVALIRAGLYGRSTPIKVTISALARDLFLVRGRVELIARMAGQPNTVIEEDPVD